MQLLPDVPDELVRGGADNLEYDLMRMHAYLAAKEKPFMTGPYGLLSVGKDVKTVKGEKYGIRTGVLYLAPANLSGTELCNSRTKGCSAVCLWTSGHGAYANVKLARLRKTMVYLYHRDIFMAQLNADILRLKDDATSKNMEPAVRLNGTSDIDWTKVVADNETHKNIFWTHPDIHWYDYTKRLDIVKAAADIPNYHITFSRAETKKNHADCEAALELGANLTVVFGDKLPATYLGYPVLDGDKSDIRFWDRARSGDGPVVIGLKAKGQARNDKESGFVIWQS